MKTRTIRNKIKPVIYFGYLQGYKVWLDGIKYPRKHGHFYTALNPLQAIETARSDKANGGN